VHVHVSTVRTTTVLVVFCKWRKRLEKWEQTTIIRKKWKLATASRTQEMSLKLKTGVRTDLSITGRHKMLFGSLAHSIKNASILNESIYPLWQISLWEVDLGKQS